MVSDDDADAAVMVALTRGSWTVVVFPSKSSLLFSSSAAGLRHSPRVPSQIVRSSLSTQLNTSLADVRSIQYYALALHTNTLNS